MFYNHSSYQILIVILYVSPILKLVLSFQIFFLLVNLIVFLLGKPILGTQQMALTVLVASGNWVLLMLSKLYTPDIYLSGLTLIGIFLGIRFYKKPNLTWLFLFILVNLELSRVSPYNGLILGLIYPIGMNLLMKLP